MAITILAISIKFSGGFLYGTWNAAWLKQAGLRSTKPTLRYGKYLFTEGWQMFRRHPFRIQSRFFENLYGQLELWLRQGRNAS